MGSKPIITINFKNGTQEYPIRKLSGFSQMFDDLFADTTLLGNIITIPFNCKLFTDYLDFNEKTITNPLPESSNDIYDMLLVEKYLCVYNYKVNVDFILKYWKNIDGKIMKSIIDEWDIKFIEELFIKYDSDFIFNKRSIIYHKIISSYNNICDIPLLIYQKMAAPLLNHIVMCPTLYEPTKLDQCKKWFHKYQNYKLCRPGVNLDLNIVIKYYNDPLLIILILQWQKELHLLDTNPNILSSMLPKID